VQDAISRRLLPKPKQRMITEMIGAVLAQQGR
jgi:hypothetical protein